MELELEYIDLENDNKKIKFKTHEEMGIWIENNISVIRIIDIVRFED